MKSMRIIFFCTVVFCSCLPAFGGWPLDVEAKAPVEELESFWMTGRPAGTHEIELLDGGTLDIGAQTGKVVVAGFIRGNLVRNMDEMLDILGQTARRHADNPDVMVVCVYEQTADFLDEYKTAAQKADPALITGINTRSDTAFDPATVFMLIPPNGLVGNRKAYFAPATAGRMLDAAIAGVLNPKPGRNEEASPLEWTFRSGRTAPDFTVRLADGKTLAPSDFRGKTTVFALGILHTREGAGKIFHILDAVARDYQNNPEVQFFGAVTLYEIEEEDAWAIIDDLDAAFLMGITDNTIGTLYNNACLVLVDADGIVQGTKRGWGVMTEGDLRRALELHLSGAALSSADPQLPASKMVRADLVEAFSLSGRPAPELEYPLLGGGTFRLSEQKGKIVIVDFWATWCGPCRGSFAKNNTILDYFADRDDVMVIGICMNGLEKPEELAELVATYKPAYPIALGSRNWAEGAAYNIHSIPCPILVGPDGIVQGRIGHGEEEEIAVAAIQTLLDGGTLRGAVPYTEKELKYLAIYNPEEWDSRELQTKAFQLTGSIKLLDEEPFPRSTRRNFGNMGQIRYAIPQPFAVFHSGRDITVVDVESGAIHARATLPEDYATVDNLVYLRTPRGGVIAASSHWRLTFLPLYEGGTPWRQRLHGYHSSLYVLPVSPEEDVLMTSLAGSMQFYDAEGNAIFSHGLPYPLQAIYILPDGKGRTSFVLYNPVEAFFYDFIFPPEPVEEEEQPE